MRLAGDGCDVLEVAVIVQDHRAMVFGHCHGQQVDDSCAAVVAAGGHPDLDISTTTIWLIRANTCSSACRV